LVAGVAYSEIVWRIVIGGLLASTVARADPASHRVSLEGFAIAGGGFGELAVCDAPALRRGGRLATFACLRLAAGHQREHWVAAEALELDLRLRLHARFSLDAGAGIGLLTVMANAIACGVQSVDPKEDDAPPDEPERCEIALPMQLYPKLEARLVVADLTVTAGARYVLAIPGTLLDYRAPSGFAFGVGAGRSW
jgi:hypothetical protein